jgi:hypothetical protein
MWKNADCAPSLRAVPRLLYVRRKECSDYGENIRLHHTKFNRLVFVRFRVSVVDEINMSIELGGRGGGEILVVGTRLKSVKIPSGVSCSLWTNAQYVL